MKLLGRKKKTEQNKQPSKPKKTRNIPTFTFSTPLMLGLVLSVAGVACAAALLFWSQTQATELSKQRFTEAWSEAFLSSVKQSVEFIEQDIQSVTANPAVISALKNNNPQAIQTLSQLLGRRAHAERLYISPRGQAALDSRRQAPINYAALELISNAESNDTPAAELVLANDQRYIYKAAAVQDPSTSRIIGTVLIAYDAALLSSSLPSIHTSDLHISLQQKLPSAPTLTIASKGSAQANPTRNTLSTAHPRWSLVVEQADEALTNNNALTYSAAAIAITLFSGLLAVLFAYLGLRRQVSTDCHHFSQLVQKWQMGKSISADKLRTPALQALILSLAQTANKRKPSTQTSAPPPPLLEDAEPVLAEVIQAEPQSHSSPEQEELEDPLAEDILDIDILDDELDPFGLNESSNTDTATQQSIDSSIFRAYDIRGIVGENLTQETAYWVGRAVGSQSIEQGEYNVAVARDGRLSGPELSESLIQGLVEAGCHVTDIGMAPTPVLYFATHTLEATTGVMVTGSHNPANYNGLKIVIAGETLANERITNLYERIVNKDLSMGSGSVEENNLLPVYAERICSDVALAKSLKVVIDCGNGVAGVIAQQLFERLGCEVIPLFCEVDGTFPNHHPDPGKPENLAQLIEAVQHNQADLGLAFDGDADRLGVVTNQGEIIYPDRLMMLLAKDVVSRNPGADIIFDVKCSRRLAALISGYGGRPIMWKTGHSLMKAKLKETGALLAGEMSGHIFYKERWYGFDDGLYSAARLLEIIALDSRTSAQIFSAFPSSHSTPELTIDVTDESKFEIIEKLNSSAQWGEGKVNTLDGIRVDYPTNWGLVRASNTTPTLVLRFEGDTEEDLNAIINIFRKQLLTLEPSLQWPL